jgi:TatD DNase family protein
MVSSIGSISPLVDTHCHLDEPSLADRLDKVLLDAGNAGVNKFIVPGVNPDCWGRIARIASSKPQVSAAYGVHPMFADSWSDEIKEKFASLLPYSVAVGEIGLDYRYSSQSRSAQVNTFRQQLRIAVIYGLPVLLHCRGAFRDLLDILAEEKVSRVGGIMHAFSGSPEIANECIKLGLLISVAGPVTYENAVRPVKVVQKIPVSSLVLETDSPDLAPFPCRGSVNEPAFLPYIADMVAKIKEMPYSEVAEITTLNSEKLLSI